MAAGDIVRWISNVSTAWSTAANWSTGAIPGDNEIVVFDGTGLANVAGGDESSTYQLRAITTQPEYTGNIGSSGSPLIHNIYSTSTNPEAFLTIRGTGDFYWQAGGAGVGGDDDYSALVDTAGNGTVFLDSDTSTGAALHVHIKSGNVTIAGSCGGAITLSGKRAKVTLNEHATSPSAITIFDGVLTSNRTLDTNPASYTMFGGKWIQTKNITSAFIRISEKAVLDYRPVSAVTVGTCGMHLNGVLDLSKSLYAAGWSAYVRGPLAREIGGAKQGPVVLPGNALLWVDLRDEYPTGD